MLQRAIPFFLLLIFFSFSLFAQTGTIKGTIKDAATQEAVIGANVVIEGTTTGASTDVEGNFVISKAPAGTHTVLVSYISYKTKKIENIRVEPDKTTLINTTIAEDVDQLQEVVVVGARQTNTEVAVITEIKRAEQVAVGISAQQISRSLDRDASQVMRRIPGISITDDRFVLVRGLSERYNAVMLNDVLTPSTEVDVKSFSFDIIPSSAIDRLLIFKSAAPELPGEFAGGVIKIYTKTIPDGNSFTFGLSTSYRDGTTFREVTSYKGGKLDFLGFDNGTRALPDNFPSRSVINQGPTESNIGLFRSFPQYFNLNTSNAMPDLRANIGLTRRFSLGNLEVTNITSVNYTNSRQFAKINQYRYLAFDANEQRSDTSQVYNDDSYSENARLGVMSNFGFLISPTTKIEFRNLFNQLSTKETILRTGANIENNLDLNNYAFRYESKSLYSGQLNGTHSISDKTTIKWTGGFSYTRRDEPDFRRFSSSRPRGQQDVPFRIDVPQTSNASLIQAARFYSELNEYVMTGSGSVERKLNLFGLEDTEELQTKLRAGVYVERKTRDFSARWFGYVNPKNTDKPNLTPGEFFSNENISANADGMYLSEGTNFDDSYDAQNLLAAGYIGSYIPFSEKFNVAAGVRVEYNRQQLQSRQRGSGAAVDVDNPIIRTLPSINAAYNFSSSTLVRLAYGISLNRPEFRELAPFSYYDFAFDVGRTGNPNLKTPTIHNFDARFEWYPTESEIVSIGAFYKRFNNPIETVIRYSGSGTSFTYGNADQATSIGAEVEIRKSLRSLSATPFIQNFTLLLNASLINSEVELGSQFIGQDNKRQLQGQSPYLVNTGLYYNDQENGFQVNLLYNVIGRRIFQVGDNLTPTIYEMPRNVIDLNITKSIGERLEIRAGIQDILNQRFRLIQDSNLDSDITSVDEAFQSYRRGSYTTLGINYRF